MNDNENAGEVFYDPQTGGMVVSEISPEEFDGNTERFSSDVRRVLASWAEEPIRNRSRGLFARDKFLTPSRYLEQLAMCYDAMDDDVVGNVADTSEAMALQKVSFESEDKDYEDVWNQIARNVDLDSFMRTAWHELFAVSQFYAVTWWDWQTFTPRGKGEKGRRRRKEYRLWAPQAMGFLDPTRVVPVRADLFGNTGLAWHGKGESGKLITKVLEGGMQDRLVERLFVARYVPSEEEAQDLQQEGIDPKNLWELNPNLVWRHSLTKAPFDRWPRLRMKSVLPLLDLKNQLREMDRSWLLGGINFIVLVTRGTDARPSNTQEVMDTQAQVRTQSRSPIIVTDHRINIEIITPEIEHVLNDGRWSTIDDRILTRLWGSLMMPGNAGNQETSETLARTIVRGLLSRRHMLKRAIEKNVTRPFEAANEEFAAEVRLEYTPRRIDMELSAHLLNHLQELRDRGDISRDTILSESGYDQGIEAIRREFEDEEYGDIFVPVNVPYDSPDKTTPGGSGRKGGRPPGESEDNGDE